MSIDIEQLHAIVTGLVQGVNFRSSTQGQARRLGLAGWVANRADGSVEVLAEGPRAALEKLLHYLQRGPVGASVSGVQTDWRPATRSFQQFEVRW